MKLDDVTDAPLPMLAPRTLASHKGDYGRVLIVGGSRGMAGAPALVGMAALRSGAGLVTVAVPRSIQATVASFEPSLMTLGLAADESDTICFEDRQKIRQVASCTMAIALGPGLGQNEEVSRLVHHLYHQLEQPMVVDADAINALAKDRSRLASPGGARLLTPHPGEFQRLAGEACASSPSKRAKQAAKICQLDPTGRTLLVLKGYQTIVTDGHRYAVNSTGNPGMATGGTGDCLTGVLVALAAQGMSLWETARLGTFVHGLAGDLAAKGMGQISMIASDLIEALPSAFVEASN